MFILQGKSKRGFHKVHGLYKPKNRWSLDQVPAGLYDPKSTYEFKGARRVHVASNGSADSHRICTLQVLLRNLIDPAKPRRGQPRLCICFKGKGIRIGDDEKSQYHPNVYVQWQPKAWYDSKTSNQWVVDYACDEILASECSHGQRHLLLCDNLGSQTKRTNPSFAKLMDEICKADVINLLAGCTDEIQVVDAGFGALVKRHTEDVQMDWLQVDANWEEWTGANLTASRRRILITQWYGEGYERACESFDFCKVFNRTGGNLSADGSNDDLIKLQGLEKFEFELADAQRNAITGEMPSELVEELTVSHAHLENDEDAARSDGEDIEELTDNETPSSDDGGDTTDDEDGQPFECPDGFAVIAECPEETARDGLTIAHRFDVGWFEGKIRRKVSCSDNPEENGKYACKYADSRKEFFHDLFREDYGVKKMWVTLKKT